MDAVNISHLDHLVLTVRDIEASCKFYTEVLGMKEITFQETRKALLFGKQKINLHQYENEFEPRLSRTDGDKQKLLLKAS